MAFCTSCGAPLDTTKNFCTSCGTAVSRPAGAAAPAAAAAAAPALAPTAPVAKGGGAMKIVLIVLGVIFLIFVIAVGGIIYAGYRAKRALEGATISTGPGGETKITTSMGNIEANPNADADAVLESIGVDRYPGATAVPGSATTGSFGGIATATVKFESSDAPDSVYKFYKDSHSDAMASQSGNEYTLIFGGKNKQMVTMNIKGTDGGSEFEIASVTAPPKN